MQNYRKTTHSTYDIKYHIVWITKYRKPVITGKIAERTRELIRGRCKQNDVEIGWSRIKRPYSLVGISAPASIGK